MWIPKQAIYSTNRWVGKSTLTCITNATVSRLGPTLHKHYTCRLERVEGEGEGKRAFMTYVEVTAVTGNKCSFTPLPTARTLRKTQGLRTECV
jgi:hypothetical protein